MTKTTNDNPIIRHEDDGGVWYENTGTGRCWEYCATCDHLYCFIGTEEEVTKPCHH